MNAATPIPKCRDCLKRPPNGRLNRKGRCDDCAQDALLFAMQVNIATADMTRRERDDVRKVLRRFSSRKGTPEWKPRATDAARNYAAATAFARGLPKKKREVSK